MKTNRTLIAHWAAVLFSKSIKSYRMKSDGLRLWCRPSVVLFGVLVLMNAQLLIAAHVAPQKEAQVTQVIRDVKLLPNGQTSRAAAVNDMVNDGTAMRTGDESRSELTFTDLTIARLGANTIFSFNKAGRDVELDGGTILVRVPKDSGGAGIHTRAVSVGITGTTLIMEVARAVGTKLILLEGNARLSLSAFPKQSQIVRAGQMLEVPDGAKTLPPPVNVNLNQVMKTHPLITEFKRLPSYSLILAAANEQHEDSNANGQGRDFHGQDLSGHDFKDANLKGANFSDAILKEAILSNATLTGANFRGADLTGARGDHADFTGADFREATLTYAYVSEANLSQANLQGVNLKGVNFYEVKFRGANLRDTKGWSSMGGCDFSGANLCGANLRNASGAPPARFRGALYDNDTQWPDQFDVQTSGAKLVKAETGNTKAEGDGTEKQDSSRMSPTPDSREE